MWSAVCWPWLGFLGRFNARILFKYLTKLVRCGMIAFISGWLDQMHPERMAFFLDEVRPVIGADRLAGLGASSKSVAEGSW
jgi:hypothetical protein